MTAATLERTSLATFDDVVAGLVPRAFASRDDVAACADALRQRVGTRTSGTVAGQVAWLRVSPGTVGLRVQTIWDATEGWDGRDAGRIGRIASGPWAGHVYGFEVAGRDTARAARLDRAYADELEDDAVAELARAGLHVIETYGAQRPVRRAVVAWSRRSRSRMAERIAELDYSGWAEDGGTLAMVTLTVPGPWELLAPTGRAWKRLVDVFRKRWVREVGTPWRGLWKLEFQRRGAPHHHMLLRVPALVDGERFETWLSRTWAEVCLASLTDPDDRAVYLAVGAYDKHLAAGTAVDFSGVKYSDPRRTAIYFSKHGSKTLDDKEYQHVVPGLWRSEGAGPGRFWGVWGLRKATAELELPWASFVRARRILRHVARARQAAVAIARARSAGESVRDLRKPRRRGGFGAVGGGWVLVNDGVALAYDVGRALAQS